MSGSVIVPADEGGKSQRASRKSFLRDGIIIALIIALMFGFLELSIRLLVPQTLDTTYLAGESFGLRDSVLGVVNRPNSRTLVSGPEFKVEYAINAQGFRDQSIYPVVAAEGVTRILLLGDSFTFGASNNYDDIWPVMLENGLRKAGHKVEIIKAGVPAYDTRLEVLYLERLFDLYHPDVVVMGFLPNDLFTNMPIVNTADTSPESLKDMGIMTASGKKSELQSLTLAKRLLMMNDELYAKLYMLSPRRAFFASPPTDLLNKQVDVTVSLFSKAKDFCHERGCELMVLSIPQQFQVIEAAKQIDAIDVDPDYIDRKLGQTAVEWGVSWIPLLPTLTEAYKATGEDLFFRYDGHLNAAGNQAVGAVMIDFLDAWLKQHASDSGATAGG